MFSWGRAGEFQAVLRVGQVQKYTERSPYLVGLGLQQKWQFKDLQQSPITERAQFSHPQGLLPELDNCPRYSSSVNQSHQLPPLSTAAPSAIGQTALKRKIIGSAWLLLELFTASKSVRQPLKAPFNLCPTLSSDPSPVLSTACHLSPNHIDLNLEDLWTAFIEVCKHNSLVLLLVLQ